ncbi:helix-turn-helix domain-containing protein [Candidatus Palauibacter sp.]|uniref:helix-turn-helix domain-containing protein n=1 Tax=Candidatus Palauibacter sp. TaxID=3101350 RepID=UPI003B01BAFA
MFGRRLRLARKRAGLSLRALAERMEPKVTAQAISKYETGKMMPSSAVLVGLAQTLDVSPDFLMSSQVEVLDGLEFRKHSGTSARDRARAEAVLIDNLERYLTIEEILGIPPASDRFEGRRYDSVADVEEIDARADELRNAWDVGLDPVPSLCALLEGKESR